jgi:hypothetical protein
MKKRRVLGRKDLLDFPDFDLSDVPVKVDTGAFTSAIHCTKVRHYKKNGKYKISFEILGVPHFEVGKLKFITSRFERKKIKSSTGHVEHRYVIKTRIKIYNTVYRVEFSLADRNSMKYPVLIGRKLLQKRFVVDVAKSNLSFKYKQKHR